MRPNYSNPYSGCDSQHTVSIPVLTRLPRPPSPAAHGAGARLSLPLLSRPGPSADRTPEGQRCLCFISAAPPPERPICLISRLSQNGSTHPRRPASPANAAPSAALLQISPPLFVTAPLINICRPLLSVHYIAHVLRSVCTSYPLSTVDSGLGTGGSHPTLNLRFRPGFLKVKFIKGLRRRPGARARALWPTTAVSATMGLTCSCEPIAPRVLRMPCSLTRASGRLSGGPSVHAGSWHS